MWVCSTGRDVSNSPTETPGIHSAQDQAGRKDDHKYFMAVHDKVAPLATLG